MLSNIVRGTRPPRLMRTVRRVLLKISQILHNQQHVSKRLKRPATTRVRRVRRVCRLCDHAALCTVSHGRACAMPRGIDVIPFPKCDCDIVPLMPRSYVFCAGTHKYICRSEVRESIRSTSDSLTKTSASKRRKVGRATWFSRFVPISVFGNRAHDREIL